MKLPPLTDDELQAFLREGVWVTRIATHNPDGSIRKTGTVRRAARRGSNDFECGLRTARDIVIAGLTSTRVSRAA